MLTNIHLIHINFEYAALVEEKSKYIHRSETWETIFVDQNNVKEGGCFLPDKIRRKYESTIIIIVGDEKSS